MTEPVAATIVALDESGGATLTELAAASGRRISTMQRAIEALEKADVVVKPTRGGEIQLSTSAPRRALRDIAEWRLGPDAVDEICAGCASEPSPVLGLALSPTRGQPGKRRPMPNGP